MLLVKITIMLTVLLLIWRVLAKAWLQRDLAERYRVESARTFTEFPLWVIIFVILAWIDLGMIIASLFWVLFLMK